MLVDEQGWLVRAQLHAADEGQRKAPAGHGKLDGYAVWRVFEDAGLPGQGPDLTVKAEQRSLPFALPAAIWQDFLPPAFIVISEKDGWRHAFLCSRDGTESSLLTPGEYDIVILDEINVALDFGLIGLAEVLGLLDARPEKVELVLTGRYAHPEVVKRADLVTEMLDIKHPYAEGVMRRKGIEY